MNREPFSIDIPIHRQLGEPALLHVRGESQGEFVLNLRAACQIFPSAFAGLAAVYDTIDGMPENSGTDARRPQPIRPDKPAAPEEIIPECPEHGLSKPSKFKSGALYCPHQDDAGTFCKWVHTKPERKQAGR